MGILACGLKGGPGDGVGLGERILRAGGSCLPPATIGPGGAVSA